PICLPCTQKGVARRAGVQGHCSSFPGWFFRDRISAPSPAPRGTRHTRERRRRKTPDMSGISPCDGGKTAAYKPDNPAPKPAPRIAPATRDAERLGGRELLCGMVTPNSSGDDPKGFYGGSVRR